MTDFGDIRTGKRYFSKSFTPIWVLLAMPGSVMPISVLRRYNENRTSLMTPHDGLASAELHRPEGWYLG
jgi:hypothetical protein